MSSYLLRVTTDHSDAKFVVRTGHVIACSLVQSDEASDVCGRFIEIGETIK